MRAPLCFSLGVLALLGAWLAPLGAWIGGPFSAHMTMHMGVVALAAPLIALGLAGTRLDPVPRARAVFAPVPASIAELVLVWAWHTPVLHHAARTSQAAFVLEQGSFLLSGLWLWLSAFGGRAWDHEQRGTGILGLLLTSMHMTLLGALLALPPRPLFGATHAPGDGARQVSHAVDHGSHAAHAADHGSHDEHAVHGGSPGAHGGLRSAAEAPRLSPLADQHLGGAIMIVLGGASYLTGGLWLARGLLAGRRGRLGARAPGDGTPTAPGGLAARALQGKEGSS